MSGSVLKGTDQLIADFVYLVGGKSSYRSE